MELHAYAFACNHISTPLMRMDWPCK